MRMCGINQVHGGFTHEHTHRVYILHTRHTHTQRAIQTLKPCQWRLKAFRKVFDLSISIVCFIAHIFYAVYAQNSVRSVAHVLVTIAHKVENSLEPNISESLYVCYWVCLWPVVLRCGVVFSATAGGVREKPHCGTLCALKFPTWGNTHSQKGENATAKEMRNVCTLLRGPAVGGAWLVQAHTMLDVATLQTSAFPCPCKS